MAAPAASTPRAIASTQHFVIMLLIQAALVALGFWMQHQSGSDSVFPQHRNVAWVYLWVIALEWGLVAMVRGGLKAQGLRLADVIGGRWSNLKVVVFDLAISIPFLLVWFAAARLMHRVLGPDQAKSINNLLPQSTLEVVLWIGVSISAGICEEIVLRGYFQKQFAAYTNSMIAAVLLQGVVFGLGYSYQGLKQVLIISVLGMLYGWFAVWRRSLRPNIIAHAWTDVWSGWLSGLLR
jgi:uncharacterized protein